MTKSTLRQRKKERTRARLIEVSQRLFAKQGYDATTLEQICEEAEVSVPTLLVYFESKERLALTPDYDTLAEFRARVEDPDRRETTVDLWRAHVESVIAAATKPRRAHLRHYQYQTSSPAFVRGTVTLLQQYEDVLAEGLARDLGTDPRTNLVTRLLATTLVFGDQMVVRHWLADGGKGDLAAMCNVVVDFVAESLPKESTTISVRRAN